MGNPKILPAAPPPAVEPLRRRVLWTVYLLRDRGAKLPRDAVLRTAATGLLQLWRVPDGGLCARLLHGDGHPTLHNLWNVRVMRGEPGGGMLLQGTVLSVRSGTMSEVPQGWWCLVHSIEPAAPEPEAARAL